MTTARCRKGMLCGFTLIEILVVVAIIALLISILLPSLRVAREESRAVVCGTHLDNIFTGILLYTQANQDVLPHLGYRGNQTAISWWWTTQIAPHIANQFDIYACPSDKLPEQTYVIIDGRKLIAVDPDSPPKGSVALDVSYQGACDLLDDSRACTVLVKGQPTKVSPMARKITSVKRPAMNIALVEGRDADRSESCFRFERLISINKRPNARDKLRMECYRSWERHNKSTNVLFLDGHVSRHSRWELAEKLSQQQEYLPDAYRRKGS